MRQRSIFCFFDLKKPALPDSSVTWVRSTFTPASSPRCSTNSWPGRTRPTSDWPTKSLPKKTDAGPGSRT